MKANAAARGLLAVVTLGAGVFPRRAVADGSVAGPPAATTALYDLTADRFLAEARRDIAVLRRYDAGMARIVGDLARRRDLFPADDRTPLGVAQRRTWASAWAALYEYAYGTEAIRQRWWDFVISDPRDEIKHPVGYLVTHAALTTLLEHGLDFVHRTQGRKPLEVMLDEPDPEFGLPAGAFAAFKFKVVHVTTTTQLLTGDAYRRQMEPLIGKIRGDAAGDLTWLLGRTKAAGRAARARLKRHGVGLFLRNALDIARDTAHAAIFPVQAGVAGWMGDARVHRQGRPLIAQAQVDALVARMQPGDVIVERQNWFLSNIGLPGFWPHAELFLGTPADLAAYFDGDADVAAWVAAQGPGVAGTPAPAPANAGGRPSFTAWLRARHPEAWRHYDSVDEHGQPRRILEAISEGVSFTTAVHGMQGDYVAVMRPRASKVEKARAIARAFAYAGRPYDFDFDFFSDRTLVCTELVWKSYAPDAQVSATPAGGFGVPLVEVAGRMTLPANELVRFFDAQASRPAASRVLEFVGFLDGREKDGRAVEADESAFRASHRRVKWDVAQD